jgi:predicted DNA-binding transcriptional regulator YafY
MPAERPGYAAVEAACIELARAGRQVTFKEVAERCGTSRNTLYRRVDLRALVEDHRARGRGATTLSGLTVQVDQLRHSLEAVAAKVRRHEEAIRRIERQRKGN